MGKAWDSTGVAFDPATWREAFRVAKPGAHLLAFGGTRTYHRLASAIEDAGWEIRDCLVWAYASGFPKSLDVGKAIDKAAGAERAVVGSRHRNVKPYDDEAGWNPNGTTGDHNYTAPATPDAAKWDGWGTALKPAWEPIVMARKPLRGTVAQNVLAHGTGALNIGATRIGMGNEIASVPQSNPANRNGEVGQAHTYSRISAEDMHARQAAAVERQQHLGRWPANLLLTDPIFDGGVPGVVGGGAQDSGDAHQLNRNGLGYGSTADGDVDVVNGGSGTYSRFFLVPKSSRSDREPLLRGTLAEEEGGAYANGKGMPGRTMIDGQWVQTGTWEEPNRKPRANSHPTVKPLDLMRHLVRLVTPPGGTVLDPFLGSGTTAIAANAEGFRAIGIEREKDYLDIAVARLAHQEIGLGLDVAAPVRKAPKTHPDLSKHQPKRRAASENYTGGWVGTVDEVPA